jgi:hypothetical protein
MDRHAATRRLRHLAQAAGIQTARAHPTCSVIHSSRPCLTLASTCAMCRSPPVTPTLAPRCVMAEPARTWTAHPNYILAAYIASGS